MDEIPFFVINTVTQVQCRVLSYSVLSFVNSVEASHFVDLGIGCSSEITPTNSREVQLVQSELCFNTKGRVKDARKRSRRRKKFEMKRGLETETEEEKDRWMDDGYERCRREARRLRLEILMMKDEGFLMV